jgi:hypothetical protein
MSIEEIVVFGAGAGVSVAILLGCDFATLQFFRSPSANRALLVRTLGALSVVATAGYYLLWIVGAILLLGPLAKLAGFDLSTATARLVFPITVAAAISIAALSRRSLKMIASFLSVNSATLPSPDVIGAVASNMGRSLPWFPAMEYYALILNRTYKVFIADGMLCGASVRGLVASPPTPLPNMDEQAYWVNTLSATLYEQLDVTSNTFRKLSFTNFQIRASEIESVDYDPTKKWGMGNVPHSGKLNVRLRSGRRRELILLGRQDGNALKQKIMEAMRR